MIEKRHFGIPVIQARLRAGLSFWRPADGFTLLEILIALAILGLSLSVVFGSFSLALDRTRAAKTKSAAEQLARTLLLQSETTDPAALKNQNGQTTDHLTWRVQISDYGSAEERTAWKGDAKDILVLVSWEDHGSTRSVSLHSMRLVKGDGLAGAP